MPKQPVCDLESVVAIYASRGAVEDACRALQRSELEMTTVSFVCRDQRPSSDEPDYFDAQGFYPRDLWGMQFGFNIVDPRIGTVFIAGAIAVRTAYDIEATFGSLELDHLSASFGAVAIPSECVSRYESELEQGRQLLIVDGLPAHVEEARKLLAQTQAIESNVHSTRGRVKTPLANQTTSV